MKTILYLALLVAAAAYYGSEAQSTQRTTNAEHGWTDDDWTTDYYEGRTTDDNGGWTDDDYVTDDYDSGTTHEYKGWVSCGCHDAPSCRQCGSQPHLCNGDCTWNWSGCRRKHGPGPSRPPPPPTGETPVSMGTRPPPTWETPVHISRPHPTGESRPPPSGGPRPPPTGESRPPPSRPSRPPPSGGSRPPPSGGSRPPPSRPSRPPPSGGSRPPPTGESRPPPTGPDGTTAEALKAVALVGGVNNEDKVAAGVAVVGEDAAKAVVGEDAATCSLPNMQENPTQHASHIFKDHIVLCGGEVNKQISSKCLKMSMGSSPAWTAAPTLDQPVKHTAMAVLADKLMLLGGQTQAIRGMPLTQEEFKGDRSASEPIHVEEMKCGPEQTKRIISVTEANRWPNGVVPYEISATFTADERTVIAEGLQNIMDNTCVVWRAKTASDKDWVNIVNEEDGCFADLGFQGPEYGAHVLNIKGFGCMWKSTVIHEAGHNLGLQHEHNRPDRDNYWKVNWLNVKVDKAFSYFRAAWATEDVDNLKKCDDTGLTQPTDFSDCIAPYSSNTVTDFNVGYDFYSIMHYTPVVTDAAFVIDDSVPIMTIKDSSVCDTDCVNNIGQGTELTSKDIEKIKKAYNCKASATTAAPSAATTAAATTAQPSSDSPVSKQIWILSSLTGAWTKGGSLSTARYGHCAVTLNNEVVVTGGSSGGTTVLKSVEAVTAAGAGTAIPDMNQGRMYHGCTVAGGSIIVAGGIGALNGKGLDSVEKFSSGQWESLKGLGGGRYSFPMLTINDKAFIFGGISGSGAATDNILTFNGQSWDVYCDQTKPECKGIDRHGHTAANVQNIC